MILSLLATLLACASDPPVACTEMAVASVQLDVVGPDGLPLDTEVTATDASGAPVEVMCADGDTGGFCSHFVVGYEVAGAIHIHAQAFDGCNTGTGDVDVTVALDASGCHVVTQSVTLPVSDWTDMACDSGS